jgi:hypothetical protein
MKENKHLEDIIKISKFSDLEILFDIKTFFVVNVLHWCIAWFSLEEWHSVVRPQFTDWCWSDWSDC